MDKIWTKTIGSGGKWSGVIGRGKLVRFTALQAGANLSVLLYNAKDSSERYNMSDTLKAQYTAHLTTGNVLMSDNGRVLASIVEDSLGWHDTICGHITNQTVEEKYGVTSYQEMRNDWLRSGQDNLTIELVRNGLGRRDLVSGVNLFSKVYCDDNGMMHFCLNHCLAGTIVTLRTEMDILLVLSNTPNPLDPKVTYPSVPIKMEVLPAEPLQDDDVCVNHRPENRRAFENTWEYYTLL